jgi:hypothetical protein
MLGEFTICGFHVFCQKTIMKTDWGILYYVFFVCFVTKDRGDRLRECSCKISQPVHVSHDLTSAENTRITQNVKYSNLYTSHMILSQLKIHDRGDRLRECSLYIFRVLM